MKLEIEEKEDKRKGRNHDELKGSGCRQKGRQVLSSTVRELPASMHAIPPYWDFSGEGWEIKDGWIGIGKDSVEDGKYNKVMA